MLIIKYYDNNGGIQFWTKDYYCRELIIEYTNYMLRSQEKHIINIILTLILHCAISGLCILIIIYGYTTYINVL